MKIPIVHPLQSFLEYLKRHIQLKEESEMLMENQKRIEGEPKREQEKEENKSSDIFSDSSDSDDLPKPQTKKKPFVKPTLSKMVSNYVSHMPTLVTKYGNPLPKNNTNIFNYASNFSIQEKNGESDNKKKNNENENENDNDDSELSWTVESDNEHQKSVNTDDAVLDFNESFQLLIERLRRLPERSVQERLTVQQELIHLSQDFTKSAR